MFLLRIGKQGRWLNRRSDVPTDVEAAALDLTLRPGGEDELSVFQVTLEDASEVATLFSVTERDHRQSIDFIVFDDDLLGEISSAPRPDESLHPELSRRHLGLIGVDEEGARNALARRILEAGPVVRRLAERDILLVFRENHELWGGEHVRPAWAEGLARAIKKP
jgi:hypothetical protein